MVKCRVVAVRVLKLQVVNVLLKHYLLCQQTQEKGDSGKVREREKEREKERERDS